MRRALKWVVSIALLVPIVALALMFTVLRTEVGAGWVLGLVEQRLAGLTYERREGSLAGGLVLTSMGYRQDGLDIKAGRLRLVATPAMFPLALRLQRVEIDDLEIRLPSTDGDESGAVVPDSLALPLEVALEQGVVNGIRILDSDDAELLGAERFEMRARVHHEATIEYAKLVLPEGSVAARGEVDLEHPFQANVDADVAYDLLLEDLYDPVQLAATVSLSGSVGAYQLAVDGSAAVDSFTMSATGSVGLEFAAVSGEVHWRKFSWPLGGDQEDTLRSDSGSAEVSGTLDDWRLTGQAQLEAPGVAAGDLHFEASGDRNHVEADIPQAEVLGGRLSGSVFYDWAAGGEYRASLLTDQLSTNSLYAEWPAVVSGAVELSGRIEPLAVSFNARGLSAVVEGQTVVANGSGSYKKGELLFSGFTLRSGESRVSLDGSLDRPTGIDFEMDIVDLGQFVPGASGSLKGGGRYAWREDLPRVRVDLSGSGLSWNGLGAERVRLTSSPRADLDWLADLRLETEQAWMGSNRLDALTLEMNLGREQQNLVLLAEKSGYEIKTIAKGAIQNLEWEWPDWRWEGQLAQFSLAGGPDEGLVELEAAADFVLTRKEISLADACLTVTSRARACLDGGWTEQAGVEGNAVFDQIPLRLLDPYLEAVELTQALDGEVQFNIPPAVEPSASAQFTFAPGTVRFSGEDTSILETGQGLLSVQLKKGEITRGQFSLPIVGQGEVGLEFEIGDISEGLAAPVAGTLTARLNDLDVLGVFIPLVDEVAGSLQLDLDISGTVDQPYFNGRIDLRDGLFRHTASGLVLSDIQLNGQIRDEKKTELTGRFNAVQGEGRLAATVDLTDPLSPGLELSVYGQGLKIFDAEDLVMTVDPDISMAWRDGALHLDGRLAVPEAVMAPSIIPSPAVAESEDVQIVAGSLPEAGAAPSKRRKIPVFGSLELTLGRGVAIDLSVAEVDVTGETRFEWNGPLMPMARGSLELEGEILAFGQRLEITDGKIGFPEVPADNPHLNIQAERLIYGNSEIRRAGLLVTGTLRRMLIEPYTDPMTTRERAQTLLITGSDFNMERGVGAVSIGTYIAPKVFLSYGVGVFSTNNVVSVRYDLGSGWGVMATSGDSQTGVDIGYTVEN
ncbi:MAG: translocation/assembly module TamB domain-containing protein [Gammaproteobacteria bacterium]|nr:translocation/assembly module TamB domain-containing protein [Gammaproteobacteria bacterium]